MIRLEKINKEFVQNTGNVDFEAITNAIKLREKKLWHDTIMIDNHFKEIYFTIFNPVQN